MNPQRSGDTGRPGRAQVWTRVVENYAAWLLLMAGIASAGVFLTALAGGFEGWSLVAGIVTLLLFAGCWLSFRDSSRREAAEPNKVRYHPDAPDVVIDVDQDTGERQRHRD